MREPTFISSTFDLRRSHSWPFVCARTCILPAYVPWTADELVTWTPRDSSALCSRAMPRTRTSVMTKRRDGHSRSAMVLLRLSSPTCTAEPSFGLTLSPRHPGHRFILGLRLRSSRLLHNPALSLHIDSCKWLAALLTRGLACDLSPKRREKQQPFAESPPLTCVSHYGSLSPSFLRVVPTPYAYDFLSWPTLAGILPPWNARPVTPSLEI